MCGIAGLLRVDTPPTEAEIKAMTAAIAHRGPDGFGHRVAGPVALGHRRLAIIDLATGQQPMGTADDQVWITFNGEIYNYRELMTELQAKGHHFRTASDTEVILHAYVEWGRDAVRRLRGMFAFAIADYRQQALVVARDPFGIKPLLIRRGPTWIAFASEFAALLTLPPMPRGRLEAVDDFLRYQFIPGPRTIFDDIEKSPPGLVREFGFDGHERAAHRVFDVAALFTSPMMPRTDADAEAEAAAIVRETVNAHLVSDVPFGVFLSGGVDSTLIAAQMRDSLGRDVAAFSIGFSDAAYNELAWATDAAKRLGLTLHTEVVEPDAIGLLDTMLRHYGEPFGDSSAIPTWYVAKLARRQVPMVLSGDGGDELFAGYGSYQAWMAQADALTDWRRPLRLVRRWLRRLGEWIRHGDEWRPWLWERTNFGYFTANERQRLWQSKLVYRVTAHHHIGHTLNAEERCRADWLRFAQATDVGTYLVDDILTKVDVASMAHGLEVRPPLVDPHVARFAASLAPHHRLRHGPNGWVGKWVLKQVLARRFPPEFVYRPKQGFAIPRDRWFLPGQPVRKRLEEVVASAPHLRTWFNRDAMQRLIHEHSPAVDHSPRLWLLLVLGLWCLQHRHVAF